MIFARLVVAQLRIGEGFARALGIDALTPQTSASGLTKNQSLEPIQHGAGVTARSLHHDLQGSLVQGDALGQSRRGAVRERSLRDF